MWLISTREWIFRSIISPLLHEKDQVHTFPDRCPCVAWFLVAWLVYDFFAGNMSVNPIQEITQRTGRYAIWFLVASLACTPVYTLFKFSQALTARRALGLYAFMFASFHFLTFSGLDYQFNLSLLYGAIFEKRFVVIGSIVFLILLALAITSTRGWQKRLGKNWKRLHKFVYIAGGYWSYCIMPGRRKVTSSACKVISFCLWLSLCS